MVLILTSIKQNNMNKMKSQSENPAVCFIHLAHCSTFCLRLMMHLDSSLKYVKQGNRPAHLQCHSPIVLTCFIPNQCCGRLACGLTQTPRTRNPKSTQRKPTHTHRKVLRICCQAVLLTTNYSDHLSSI